MKTFFAVMILAASALAQDVSFRVASACGPKDASFTVKLDGSQHALEPAGPGKATVYFVQDDGILGEQEHYVLKIGMDGAWVGAYKTNSYFTVSTEPGEHHICVNIQSNSSTESLLALAHFTAKPGSVYYFRTRFLGGLRTLYPSPPYLDLEPLDSDEGKYLISYYPLSVSQAKK